MRELVLRLSAANRELSARLLGLVKNTILPQTKMPTSVAVR